MRWPIGWLGLCLVFLLSACAEPQDPMPDVGSLARARLLTAEQYTNTIADVFGADIAESVIPPVPPLARTDGLLASGAASVGLTSDQLSQVQQAASVIAGLAVDEDHRAFLLSCRPETDESEDSSCARQVLGEVAPLLYRRPIAVARLDELVDLADRAARELESFHDGLAIALEAVLVSPEMLLIVDQTEADPARPGEQRLDAHALASRLSYFLWNAPPDDALLAAAADGSLQQAAVLSAQVDRMLSSPRLEAGMRAFFDDMFAFDEFNALAKDPSVYPRVTGATIADAREQTLRTVIEHTLGRDADYRDIFTSRQTVMSMPLAAVYGVPSPTRWAPFEFPADSQRSGILTHLSFLSAHAHPVRSSPTLRGKALRELFLCQKVPDPPPNVDFSAIEDAGEVATARERLDVHNRNPSCAGCHLITDPMGLALENFDGAGQFRETEQGAPIDITGELDGVRFESVAGLTDAVRNHPKLSYCLVNRLYAYGTGGPVSLKHERRLLKWHERRFGEQGHRLRTLLKDLATSPAFARVRSPEDPSAVVSVRATVDPAATALIAQAGRETADPGERPGLTEEDLP
ncbi:MAG: DUF1592 domain-containing protein [Pseudomonadota bacterium]